MLSERQQKIMRLVVEAHLESGKPVGSAAIAERDDVVWGPSTVRAELAALEREGLLTHPHTSAGRLPTDSGYRLYADALLAAGAASKRSEGESLIDLTRMRREIEDALRETTSALSRMTDLLAVATAPPPSSARVRRVEALLLQPRAVMIVVIASNGAVTKRVFNFERPVDLGLVEWASSFLNERLSGLALGARMTGDRLDDPELGPAERSFLEAVSDAFRSLTDQAAEDLYVEGASRLLSVEHAADLPHADTLMRALDRRANLLRMLRSALDERSIWLWIGGENPAPELRNVSVVGANYGLGYRNLGTVGVIGPTRMNYATAIESVRDAAGELSRFFETVYER